MCGSGAIKEFYLNVSLAMTMVKTVMIMRTTLKKLQQAAVESHELINFSLLQIVEVFIG